MTARINPDRGARVGQDANGGWEYPAFLAAAAIVQCLIGDGAQALRSSARAIRS